MNKKVCAFRALSMHKLHFLINMPAYKLKPTPYIHLMLIKSLLSHRMTETHTKSSEDATRAAAA